MINLPDGRFLITEKTGFMNVSFYLTESKFLKLKASRTQTQKDKAECSDVALDPDFKTNNIIYSLILNLGEGKIILLLLKENFHKI
ncbi:PQQ-dependent sugar dehydrogenase [Chryseobacterium indoltheticum]|uniref:PQQ-dependent sugar dehydrogenase n=1 Tax=Chryseobacterium indoltheticum TaxID=254 RepID=UPI003F49A656